MNQIANDNTDTTDTTDTGQVRQEVGLAWLAEQGITVICSDQPKLLQENDPTSILVRQIFGCFCEFMRSQLVARLKHGRESKLAAIAKDPRGKRDLKGRPKLTGRRAKLLEDAKLMGRLAKLIEKRGKGKKPSFTTIGKILKKQNASWATKSGKPFAHGTIARWASCPRLARGKVKK